MDLQVQRSRVRPLACWLIVFLLASCTNDAVTIDNTRCTVLDDLDDGSFHSLRRKLEQGYNRSTYRACTETIVFAHEAPEFHIVLGSPLRIEDVIDTDFDKDGFKLFIDTAGAPVTLDATGLLPDSCALEVLQSKVHIGPLTIRVRPSILPLCMLGEGGDVAAISIEQVK